jgi:cytidine deaminase
MNDKIGDLLFKSARKAIRYSYAPYSRFNVSSAVLTDKNKIFSGCNVENASYGGTICAERVAILKAISEGHKGIKAILVMTKKNHPVSPCGLCGQTLLEFMKSGGSIYLATSKKIIKKLTLNELLPYGFTKKQLT